MDIITAISNIQGKIDETYTVVNEKREALSEAEKHWNNAKREMAKLKRIKRMSEHGETWEWQSRGRENGLSKYDKMAWKEIFSLTLAEHVFYVSVKERSDLKKYKFQVEVSGYKSDIDYQGYSRYSDHKFVSRYYGYDENGICEKFTNEESARQYAQSWMDTISKDFKEKIEYQCGLVKNYQWETLQIK